MRYFDLHCDTATSLYDWNESLATSRRQISKETISNFDVYSQVFAVYSKHNVGDEECYKRFFKVTEYFKETNGINFALCSADVSEDKRNYILSVEDARILGGDLSRVETLYENGVRVLTPLWAGETCIGGSHDTDKGLTPFGKEALRRAAELGMILDISHASVKSADEIIGIAASLSSPVIASHCDSFALNPHTRNISDETARSVAEAGGIIGVSLHSPHLSKDGNADIDTVINHIEHLMSVAGERSVSLGCDLDGTNELPRGINGQEDVIRIADALSERGFPDSTIDKIFYKNAFDFFKLNLGKKRKAEK